ncbi:pyrroloquinoline quinone-dependent dehydrogenase [Halomonas sp. SpR1]|uniref:pyrroloquinoline quinone-dependent dehydrogenase n=1 Tax=Halomonas sp. SpR1 TaxID=3050462 RepID=UPI0027E5B4DF|nr:pyrroloquinoline quinone-dependent dehydrogenase [Halomonas sp. SpR1]MDQ7733001.1 pyrroloquinoline quinone-dependent dehydrogenase [Halomonas sp. SpR1]
MFTSPRVLAYVVSLSLATHAVAQNTEGETEIPEGPSSSEAQTDVGDSQAIQTPTFSATPQPSDAPAPGDWAAWGRESGASRHSPLDEITPDNVSQLEVAWIYRTGDMPEEEGEGKYAPENTPLKVGDNLYLCSAMNVMISLDARTGEEQWRHDPQVDPGAIPYSASCRGVTYYEVPDAADDQACATRIIEGTLDARLIAVDAQTGELCQEFGDDGTVDLWAGIGEKVPGWYSVTSPPVVVQGVLVTGAQVKDGQAEDAPSGVIRGYDAVTGELEWAWDMGNPNLDGLPPEGETYTRGTPNMWTTASSDEALGYVYLPMGNSSVDYWGGNRSEEENEFSTSLVAIDVNTGEPVWHFQTVHYDVWDYDLGSQPTLVDFPRDDGSTVPAIILPSKQGDIYVLNRETGESLFPVEEIEAPTGGVEPDNLSPTQPSSGYHSLAFPNLEEKDMWGMTPIDQLWCRIQFRRASYKGMYTPPTVGQRFIQYPGYNGGNDWGSAAVDAERGIIIANYNDIPNFNRLIPREEAEERNLRPIYAGGDNTDSEADGPAEGAGDPQIGAPYAIDVNAGWRAPVTGMPCTAPPYGGIRAIDLATGETLWDEPLGTARKNGPFGIPSYMPFKIGTPNNGGPLLTASGLIFIAAATDDLFRAIDIETGEVLWNDVLPAGGQANPITYEANGRQYVVIGAGGHHFMETPIGDYVIAYALPEDGN